MLFTVYKMALSCLKLSIVLLYRLNADDLNCSYFQVLSSISTIIETDVRQIKLGPGVNNIGDQFDILQLTK